jgi:hypothetical protein
MVNNMVTRLAALLTALLVCVTVESRADVTLLEQNFDGLTLKDATSPTETAAPSVWTEVPPAGWTRDNATLPLGNPVEFQGWTFLNKDWWVSTAGGQERGTFAAGSGTVAVADPDEYDDGTEIDPELFNAFLSTPAISLAGILANSVKVHFDSNFRAEVTQIGVLDVSFDGGTSYSNLLTYDSATRGDGELIHGPIDLSVNNPSGGSMIVRWGMTKGSNDWWWAIDNIRVSGEQVPEPSSLVLSSMIALAALRMRRRRAG